MWINAERTEETSYGPHLAAGSMKDVAAGLELKEATKKKGKWEHPSISNCHLLLVAKMIATDTHWAEGLIHVSPSSWKRGPRETAAYCASALLLYLSGSRSTLYCCTCSGASSGANPSPGHRQEGRVDFTKSSCYALNVSCCCYQMCLFLVVLGIHFPSQPETGKHSCAPHC